MSEETEPHFELFISTEFGCEIFPKGNLEVHQLKFDLPCSSNQQKQ